MLTAGRTLWDEIIAASFANLKTQISGEQHLLLLSPWQLDKRKTAETNGVATTSLHPYTAVAVA